MHANSHGPESPNISSFYSCFSYNQLPITTTTPMPTTLTTGTTTIQTTTMTTTTTTTTEVPAEELST